MTHRINVERNANAEDALDAFGSPLAPSWQPWNAAPALCWSRKIEDITDGDKLGVVQVVDALITTAEDIKEGDRASSIEDRLGTTLWSGPLSVLSVEERRNGKMVTLRKAD